MTNVVDAQIDATKNISFCYKGAWSSWVPMYESLYRSTDWSSLILKTKPGQINFFEIDIKNYSFPSKKDIKKHLKENKWYEYTGTVEYYVNDDYPTAEVVAKRERLVMPNPRIDQTPNVKRTAKATIKIQPFKKTPKVYNVWFDNIAVGLDISNVKFEKK